jgi:hypothetical protein
MPLAYAVRWSSLKASNTSAQMRSGSRSPLLAISTTFRATTSDGGHLDAAT